MTMASYISPEEFAKQCPDHPFARPAIHFVPRRSSTSSEARIRLTPTSSSAPTKPATSPPLQNQPPLPEELQES
jgi:hypothetical protein